MAIEEVVLSVTISDKPDWNKFRNDIKVGFLEPISGLVKEHRVGSLSWSVPEDRYSEILIYFHRYGEKDRYFASIERDTSVSVSIVGGMGRGSFNLTIKGLLIHLTDFFGKPLAERVAQYAEIGAMSAVMEEMKGRLTSIKATATFR